MSDSLGLSAYKKNEISVEEYGVPQNREEEERSLHQLLVKLGCHTPKETFFQFKLISKKSTKHEFVHLLGMCRPA